MMKPIIFNTDMVNAIVMVNAILREPPQNKTATRRVVKGNIPVDAVWGYTTLTPKGYISCRGTFADGYGEKFFKLPCQPGDILYVRETWAFMRCINCDGDYRRPENDPPCYDTQAVEYDDGDSISDGCFIYRAGYSEPQRICWRPSIHMPKAAARIFLRVTDVNVEWLHSMTLDDFLNEGIPVHPEAFNDPENAYMQAKEAFKQIWDYTIDKKKLDKYGWSANPAVWTIKFERCEKPESER